MTRLKYLARKLITELESHPHPKAISNHKMSGSQMSEVVAKDQVPIAPVPDGENFDPAFETLEHAIESTAQALEKLDSLRRVLLLAPVSNQGVRPVQANIDFYGIVREFEISLIKCALHHAGGRQSRAAALLNLNPTTFYMKVKTLGLARSHDAGE